MKTQIFITMMMVAVAFAEPPSPYQYNRPKPVPRPHPAPAVFPSTSYGTPAFHAAPSQPALSFQSSHSAPSLQAAPSFSIPSGSYGAPSLGFLPLGGQNGFNAQSTNQNAVFSSLGGAISESGEFDNELRSTIESILLKEESRAESFVEEAPNVIAIAMGKPTPSVGVASFLLTGSGSGGHHVNQPAPVYGPSY